MKKLLMAMVLMPLLALADTWTDPNTGITWAYAVSDGKAVIKDGSYAAISPATEGALTIPSFLGGSPVTSIGYRAFYYCRKLTSVTIPEGVTSIGREAFAYCSGLTSVTVPSGVETIWDYAFSGCSGLTTVTLPTGVANVELCAFENCVGLTRMTLPSSVTTIGNSALYGCTSLKTIVVDGGDGERIKELLTASGFEVSGVDFVEKKADGGPYRQMVDGIIWTYKVDNGKAQIGISDSSAISSETRGSITIPSMLGGCSVTSIGDYAFCDCWLLTSVTIPSGVTSIGDYAFYDCFGLTSVTIPPSVTSIGSCAFYNCSGLMGVCVSDLSAWCNIKFEGSDANPLCYGKKLYLNGDEVLELQIPESVTSIGNYAFSDCIGLTSVRMSSSVTNIGNSAFSGCQGLMSVKIPEGVANVGANAFYDCSDLTGLVLPTSTISVGVCAFGCCPNLMSVTITSNVTDLAQNAFEDSGVCEVITEFPVADAIRECFGDDVNYRDISVPVEINLTYSINDDCAIITGGTSSSAVLTIPGQIDGYAVVGIGDGAFRDREDIVGVSLPDGLRDVGYYAFFGCRNLRKFNIPETVQHIGKGAFTDTAYWNEYEGDVVEKDDCVLGHIGFSSWTDFKPIVLGDNIRLLADYAFADSGWCIGGYDYYYGSEFEWPERLQYISEGAFAGCTVFDRLIIPGTIKSIGAYAFSGGYGYSSLGLVMEEGVESIGDYAFEGWFDGQYSVGMLQEVRLPNSLTNIGSTVFGCALFWNENRECLSTVESVRGHRYVGLGRGNFYRADYSQTSGIKVQSGYNDNAFLYEIRGDGACIVEGGGYDCSIPDHIDGYPVVRIDEYAFVNCYGSQIYIPSTIKSIGNGAFTNARYSTVRADNLSTWCEIEFGDEYSNPLSSTPENSYSSFLLDDGWVDVLNVPEGVNEIKDYAFMGCSGINEIFIPNSVTNIGYYALYKAWWSDPPMRMVFSVALQSISEYAFAGQFYFYNVNGEREYAITADDLRGRVFELQGNGPHGDWRWGYQYDYFEKPSLVGAKVILSEAPVFSGREVTQFVEGVLVDGLELEEGKDFEVCNNTAELAGKYELEIVGIGMYRDSIKVPFEVFPLQISDAEIVPEKACLVYTGDELVQGIVFDSFGDKFTCCYAGNVVTNAGTYRMTVYGTGNFGGTKEIEFIVVPKTITNATVVVDSSGATHYAGDACLPSVVVTDEDRKCELVEGTDYVIEYANNKQPGLATVTVVGTNNYCDAIARQWTILAREDAEIVGAWSEPQTFEYDGKVHGVDYSARLDVMEWPLNVVTQGTIRAVNVGEYAATARAETVGVPETDSVYYRCAAVTNECTWTITPKPVTKLQIDYVSTAMIANGQQQKPQIVVRDVERGVVLTGADYAVAYENNVNPGKGIARITGKGNYGGETTIEFPIVAGVSPAEGLNMDGGTFEIVGETDWVADNVVTHDRYASMRSGAIGTNEESVLTAVVHGAGTVSFWWKVSSQHFDSVLMLDRLEFYVDGVQQKWVNGDVDWTKLSFKVNDAGPHELKWVYAKDGTVSEGQDCGWVDEVSWEKEWLIGDWLNDVDREFTSSNGASLVRWMPDSAVSSDGEGSMRSGVCQQGQRSVLSTVVENVGTLTFKWKCSCVAYEEYITDKLSLLIDGTPVKDADGKDIFINGETGWNDVSYRITGAGRHEVQWVFEKVSDASMGRDCGWVDVVHWDNEPGTLTDEDLVVEAFDGVYDGQGHGAAVSVKGVQDASVKYGASRETIGDATSPTFVNCGEHEVWFAVNVPDFNEYVGKTVVRVRPRSVETGEATLGKSLVYTGSVLTQTVASVVVDGLDATFEVSDNTACAAGAYLLTVIGTGNFCGELSVPFSVGKAQAFSGDVTVEGYSPEACAVEFTYDGKAHQPNVVAGYDGTAVVRFALTEEGPYADELNVSNVVERMDVWYEIVSANYERLVGQTQMTIRPQSIAGAEVVLGEQVSDAEGHVVQLVDSVIVNGLSVTFVVSNNVAEAEGDFELSVYGVGNFEGEAKCPYSVGGIVLPPVLTPGDGTIFTESLIVRFSAQTPDSKWYYTLDGSMPTTNSLKAARVNLHGKTTIRAIAVLDGKLRSAVVESHYALGACENPKISLDGQDGCVFHFPEQLVVIDRNGEEGVVRYTLDGSEPTADSPAYEGPFAISVSTTVKAKTFSDSWFDSETVMANMRLETLPVPSPVIDAVSEYCGTKTTVSLSCTLSGAVIRYTLDGSEPTATSDLYEQPFEIGGEVGSAIRVRARAFCEHYADSSVVEAVVTRVWGVGDTLGVPDMTFETDGWVVDTDETFAGRESMRSGPTDDGETNTLETVVHGGGIVAFSWRTSCEDSFGDFIWDRAEFWVDGDCIAKVEGESGWTHISHAIQHGDADHRLRWLYVKDPDIGTAEGDDCAWLAALTWKPEATVLLPSIADDPGATVTGDAETGFVVKPSEGKVVVEVTIPQGVDAAKVTVEVPPTVASVKPNGAKVKIVNAGADITQFLNVPAVDGNGVIDLAEATVKEEIVKEAMDIEKGAVIELNATDPKLKTPATREGLFYQLREGETLEGMKYGDYTAGNGQPWSPKVSVKGGNSAFYSIDVKTFLILSPIRRLVDF